MSTASITPTCVECGEPMPPGSTASLCGKCQLWNEIQDKPNIPPQIPGKPKVGDVLGNYQLTKKLGEGGMGMVFRARDETLGRDVAIKILPQAAAMDEEFKQRFLREARAIAGFTHPNIVQIYYIGQQEEVLFYAMELVEGRDLHSYLQERKQLTEEEAVACVRQAALGLQHAARHGIVHRDIKPANLMLTTDGIIKIADFGLVKKLDDGTTQSLQLTATQAIMGTPHYISPEQARGNEVDARSDIYSLGATLYHLLAGHPPYNGHNAMSILLQHLDNPLPPIHQSNPTISPQLASLLGRMMAKDATARPQSYDELIYDLDHYASATVQASPVTSTDSQPKSGYTRFFIPAAVALIIFALGAFFWPPQTPPPIPGPSNDDNARNESGIHRQPQDGKTVVADLKKPDETLPAPPPMEAKPFFPITISMALNANLIRAESNIGMNFEPGFQLNWGTASWMKRVGENLPGLPDDGRVAIPDITPPSFFQVDMTTSRNTILFTDKQGRHEGWNPTTVVLSREQQGRYTRLAFLTGGCWGDGIIKATLRYNEGQDDNVELRILDWNPNTRAMGLAPNQSLAVRTRARRLDGTIAQAQSAAEMFSQIISCDPYRTLQSIHVSLVRREDPRGLESHRSNFPRFFTGAIFAISAQTSPE